MQQLNYILLDCLPILHNFPQEAIITNQSITVCGKYTFDGVHMQPVPFEDMSEYYLNKLLQERLKYIVSEEYAAIFHPGIQHKNVAPHREICSAGFCVIVEGKLQVFGESISRKVKSNPAHQNIVAKLLPNL